MAKEEKISAEVKGKAEELYERLRRGFLKKEGRTRAINETAKFLQKFIDNPPVE